ncbi:glycosyl transferase [Polaribacter pacificus]|uniref:Glycosyl transferase n=1 Tax=Polaribacter pacificus TaxID=1775173 RepID=A0A917I0P3_9FLAO|nr:glycosyltransferase [Polaribacter pacificus]GGG99508.1 glycosyl transferase [Polaribacter pacificus]
MKFGIITHVEHKIKGKDLFAYEPYVREMNLWAKYVDEIIILAPKSKEKKITNIETPYRHSKIKFIEIPSFNLTTFNNSLISLKVIPKICIQIYKVMKSADHIHLRCPGNIGLLGCFVQIFFPSKPKTVKYAGNWDPKSKQPLSYRLQKWILSNTFLTKNCKVLIYGEWKNQSKNSIPFFTASYSDNEIIAIEAKNFKSKIRLLFVGNFSIGKQPLLTVKVAEILINKGYDIQLDMFGDGARFNIVKEYILKNKLSENVLLHGNQPKEVVKKAFQESHFLVFISKSEGWPKVVAEAMFWGCLPIASKVSCVPFMLGEGERGSIVNEDLEEIVFELETYINQKNRYLEKVVSAKKWSQKFTLEKFEKEIKNFL